MYGVFTLKTSGGLKVEIFEWEFFNNSSSQNAGEIEAQFNYGKLEIDGCKFNGGEY
jgi:hypothetical protein